MRKSVMAWVAGLVGFLGDKYRQTAYQTSEKASAMSSLLPSFLRSGTSAATSNTNGRRASAPSATPNPTLGHHSSIITPDEWRRRLSTVTLSQKELNSLVMNYLVIEGYKEAAENFSRESGAGSTFELSAIEERMRIRSAIQRGDMPTAIDRINNLNPDLLDSHGRIAFHLHQQHLIELIRAGLAEEALEYSQEHLAPQAIHNTEFLRELERTMTMAVFPEEARVADLMDPTHRMKVANEVNAALLAFHCQENESRLPTLLKRLYQVQETLGASKSFPRIVNFSTARFDPALAADFSDNQAYQT